MGQRRGEELQGSELLEGMRGEARAWPRLSLAIGDQRR